MAIILRSIRVGCGDAPSIVCRDLVYERRTLRETAKVVSRLGDCVPGVIEAKEQTFAAPPNADGRNIAVLQMFSLPDLVPLNLLVPRPSEGRIRGECGAVVRTSPFIGEITQLCSQFDLRRVRPIANLLAISQHNPGPHSSKDPLCPSDVQRRHAWRQTPPLNGWPASSSCRIMGRSNQRRLQYHNLMCRASRGRGSGNVPVQKVFPTQ